jgi:OHCU decarboxylase
MITLDQLNALSSEGFVATLAGIFEHSPWVARGAAQRRPFASRLDLIDAMQGVVHEASAGRQLDLILAHPPLGAGRTAVPLTRASTEEQRRAGLDACTEADLARLRALNDAYRARHGFPFILAVRGHGPQSIIAAFERRLGNESAAERAMALEQIGSIAGFRLADTVASPTAPEVLAMLARLEAQGPGSAGARVREWMLAAGLELAAVEGQDLLGVRGAALATAPRPLVGESLPTGAPMPPGARLLLGAYHDPASQALCHEGWLGVTLGIAVAQSLKQTATRLPFDLLVWSRPPEAGRRVAALLPTAAAIHGCVALAPQDARGDAPALAPLLRAGACEDQVFAIVRQSLPGFGPQREPELDAASVGRASRLLEEFIRGSADGSDARTFVWS